MFGFKKETKPTRRASGKSLSQYGLFGMPGDTDDLNEVSDLSDDDIDLEAELAAISGHGKKPQRKPKPVPSVNLDAMIAQSLRDVPSDEDVSGDDDDPDILNELKELTIDDSEEAPSPITDVPAPPPRHVSRPAPSIPGAANPTLSLLEDRILNYQLAENNAKQNGETSRVRRFTRGLKTLGDLLKQAKAGKAINDEDIPPVVSTGKQATGPAVSDHSAPAVIVQSHNLPTTPEPVLVDVSTGGGTPELPPVAEVTTVPSNEMKLLKLRREQYKAAALSAKRSGDKETALSHLKMVKLFEQVIEGVEAGQAVDINEIPPPPDAVPSATRNERQTESIQKSAGVPAAQPSSELTSEEVPEQLISAGSVAEALHQRLTVYKEQVAKAKADGNEPKVRRMGRIVKQYEQAIKLHAAGKPLPTDLPTPPGYAPLTQTAENQQTQPAAAPQHVPSTPPRPQTAAVPAPAPVPALPGSTTRAEKQLGFLLARQKEFKDAAIVAKTNGDMEMAKEYLRSAKGFDNVIDAARGGLAVDLATLPLPPKAKQQLEDTFDIVNAQDCDSIGSETGDLHTRLQSQLSEQLMLCRTTRDHHQAMGDVAGTNRLDQLASSVKQDLDVVMLAKRLGEDPPKFHFEMKQFSVVQCCTDLGENDLELCVVRGISYNVANSKEVDTYVKFEFPYPQEEPVRDRTVLVKDTNSPEYNAVFPISIQRNARSCLRVFKRHSVKFEVYSKGWLFGRDTLLGVINVKLQPLESQVELHDSFDLMDGRKVVGGKLEIKLRVRNPLLTKQIEQKTHKWLVVDH